MKDVLRGQMQVFENVVDSLLQEDSERSTSNRPELLNIFSKDINKLNYNYYRSKLNDTINSYESKKYRAFMIQCAYIINELKGHNLFDDLKEILADAYIYQGKILRQGTKEERDRAKDNFEKALALTSTHLSAREELDSLMLERGELPNATIY
jgi:hypothetical protein